MILKKIRLLLSSIFLFLLAGHLLHIFFGASGQDWQHLFDFNFEKNIPTLYQSILWVFCGFFAYRVAYVSEQASRWMWFFFSFVFFFLATDEYFQIHDSLNKPIKNALGLGGSFHFGWVLPYAVLLLGLLPIAWKFFRTLPFRYSLKFAFSGAVFIFGAFIMEMVGAGRHEIYGRSDSWYTLCTTIEESLEIIGISLFLYFLCEYIYRFYPDLLLSRKSFLKWVGVISLLAVAVVGYQLSKLFA